MRFRRVGGMALLCGAAMLALPVQAQSSQAGVDVSTTAEMTSNPYLTSSSGRMIGAGSVEIRPWLKRENATDSLTLEGFARLRAFTEQYKLEDSYGGTLRATSRLSQTTSAYGTLGIVSSSARSLLNNFGRLPAVTTPLNPVDPIPTLPPGESLNLIGLAGRSTSLDLQSGIDHGLDPRSSVGARVGYQKVMNQNPRAADFDRASFGVSYSYLLSDRTTIGLGANASRARFDGDFPDSTTVDVYGSLNYRAAQYFTLSASAGAAVTSTSASRFGPADTKVYGVGSADACYRRTDQSMCISVSRAQQPSMLGGVRTQTSVSASVGQRLAARMRMDVSGSYVRSGAVDSSVPAAAPLAAALDQLSFRATITRSFTDRIDGYLFSSVSRVYDDSNINGFSRKPSTALGAGLRVRLGTRQ